MASVLPALVLLGVFAVIALPGLFALSRRRAAIFATPFYVVLLVAVSVHHMGLPSSHVSDIRQNGEAVQSFAAGGANSREADVPGGLCEQALDQAQQGGLIRSRANPRRVTVNREIWQQLPEQARAALEACLQRGIPGAGDEVEVEIVEQ